MEFSLLGGNDQPHILGNTVPLFCCGSRESVAPNGQETRRFTSSMAAAEQFATDTNPLLAMGDTLTPDERQTTYQQMAGLIGLPVTLIETGWTNRH